MGQRSAGSGAIAPVISPVCAAIPSRVVGGQSNIERPPAAELAGVVSSVWVQQVAADAEPYVQRNVPSGAVELVCRVGSEPRVVGPLTGALVEVLEPGTTVVGLRFRPGAATTCSSCRGRSWWTWR